MRLRTQREISFPFRVDELWQRLTAVERFPSWWPWLRTFDGQQLVVGETWQCTVQPPLPYTVSFAVSIDEIVIAHSITAHVHGDIDGTAELRLSPAPGGCLARFATDLTPRKASLRAMSLAGVPIARFAHNRLVDAGIRQFISRADT